jgi:hypothetical protein
MEVECPADGIQVKIDFSKTLATPFDGFLYVKGFSRNSECRTGMPPNSTIIEFKVKFGTCGLVYTEVRYLKYILGPF